MSDAPFKSDAAFQLSSMSWGTTTGLGCFFTWTFSMLCLGDFENSPLVAGLESSHDFLFPRLLFLAGTATASLLCLFALKQLSRPSPVLLGIAFLLTSAPMVCLLPLPLLRQIGAYGTAWVACGAGEAFWFFFWLFHLRMIPVDLCRRTVCRAMALAGVFTFLFALMYADLMMLGLAALPVAWTSLFINSSLHSPSVDPFESPSFKAPQTKGGFRECTSHVITTLREEGLSKVLLKGLHSFMFAYLFGIALITAVSIGGTVVAGSVLGFTIALASLGLFHLLQRDELLASTIITNAFVPLSCISFLGMAILYPAPSLVSFVALTGALTTMLWIMSIISSFNYLSFMPTRFIFEGWSAKACSSIGMLGGWLTGGSLLIFEPQDERLVILVMFASLCAVVILDDVFFKKMRLVMSRTIVNKEEQIAVQETATILPFSPKGDRWLEACDVLAERHSLSPRQKEVFLLLANGRNTEYITNALGLSTPTVKTHTYAVYQKLGIHSHQALIDLIEKTAFTG